MTSYPNRISRRGGAAASLDERGVIYNWIGPASGDEPGLARAAKRPPPPPMAERTTRFAGWRKEDRNGMAGRSRIRTSPIGKCSKPSSSTGGVADRIRFTPGERRGIFRLLYE